MLSQAGTGTTILTGANSYSGTTQISAGTLQIGNGGTTGTLGSNTVSNSANLVFNRSDSIAVGNLITSTGTVTQAGSGTTILTTNNNYSGATTINAGVLQVGNAGTTGALGTGAVTDNASLVFNRTNSITVGNAVGGTGSLTQAGTGTTILTGANSYAGTTTVSAGVLQIGSGSTTGTLGTGAVTDNAILSFNRSDSMTVGNSISGTGSVTKTGIGTTILTGANSYGGTTTIASGGGTLQIGNGGTTGTLGAGGVSDNATLAFNRSDTITVANAISGTGSVAQTGTGTTILTATNSYGATTISAGVLQVGNAGTTGTLGSGAVTDNATLVFNRTNSVTVSSAIGGTGSLAQAGTGTTILTGANSYGGTTTISAGTLQIGSAGTTGTLGTGAVTDNANLTFSRTDTLTVANDISGTGSLTKSSTGTTILTGANTYTGTTTVSSGTLQIGNGSTAGALGAGAVTDNATLAFNRSDSMTVGNTISGSGAVTQAGTGTTILTATNSYTGTTTISAGALQANNGVGLPSARFLKLDGGVLQGDGVASLTRSIGSSGSTFQWTANGGGFSANGGQMTVNVGGAGAEVTWGTTVGSQIVGTLQFGSTTANDKTLFANGINLNNTATTGLTRTINVTAGAGGDSAEISGVIRNSGAATNLTKTGNGTLILSAANTFSGITTVSSGTLQINNSLALQNSTLNVSLGGAVSFGTLTSATLGSLSGTQNLSLGGGLALTVGGDNATTTYSGVISGDGSLTKIGSGVLTLAVGNTFSGGTTVNGGTLVVGNVNALGSGGLTINNTATTKLQNGLSGPLRLPSLTIAGTTDAWTGTLDVTNNKVILPSVNATAAATTLSRTTNQLKTGITANLDWSGTGIVSSTVPTDPDGNKSVGVILNDGGLYGDGTAAPLWHGQSVASTDVLVAFTYAGDADLNGLIDGIDYALTDNGFNSNQSGWSNGDIDYNGVVDGIDYALLDNAFNTQGGALSGGSPAAPVQSVSVQPVPEPSAIVLAAIGSAAAAGVGVGRRRRGRDSWERCGRFGV